MNVQHINIAHVVEIDRELFWHDHKWSHVVVVITDLVTDPFENGYDAVALSQMVSSVARLLQEKNQGFSSITVRSIYSFQYNLKKAENIAE